MSEVYSSINDAITMSKTDNAQECPIYMQCVHTSHITHHNRTSHITHHTSHNQWPDNARVEIYTSISHYISQTTFAHYCANKSSTGSNTAQFLALPASHFKHRWRSWYIVSSGWGGGANERSEEGTVAEKKRRACCQDTLPHVQQLDAGEHVRGGVYECVSECTRDV
jgi:hypothetical protein